MSNTTDSTRTLKTAAAACCQIGLTVLAATVIMVIVHVTSFISYLLTTVVALRAIADDVLMHSWIQTAEGKH